MKIIKIIKRQKAILFVIKTAKTISEFEEKVEDLIFQFGEKIF